EIPFNAPPDKPTRVFIHDGKDPAGNNPEVIEFPICNQYTVQGDLFSRAIRENSEQPTPLEDAVKNMAVIDAVFRSGDSGCWETVLHSKFPPLASKPSKICRAVVRSTHCGGCEYPDLGAYPTTFARGKRSAGGSERL